MVPLAAASMESYSRAYPYFAQLHMLAEVDQALTALEAHKDVYTFDILNIANESSLLAHGRNDSLSHSLQNTSDNHY